MNKFLSETQLHRWSMVSLQKVKGELSKAGEICVLSGDDSGDDSGLLFCLFSSNYTCFLSIRAILVNHKVQKNTVGNY